MSCIIHEILDACSTYLYTTKCTNYVHHVQKVVFCFAWIYIYLSTLILSEGPSPSNFRSPNKLIEGSFRVVVPYPCMLISHIHLNMSPTLVGTHIQFTSINKRYVTLLWVQFPTPNNHGCWIG